MINTLVGGVNIRQRDVNGSFCKISPRVTARAITLCSIFWGQVYIVFLLGGGSQSVTRCVHNLLRERLFVGNPP